MDAWFSLYSQVAEAIGELGGDRLLFRGHGDSSWPLLPGLGRAMRHSDDVFFLEQATYFDFITRAGELLRQGSDSWSILFTMQHHGLPTRLLDWSETFGVALYFALKEGQGDAAIWILNPFALNKESINSEVLLHPDELHGSYSDYYINKTKTIEGNVVAISPLRHNPRVFHQRAGFTLHDNIETPLEKLHPRLFARSPFRLRLALMLANSFSFPESLSSRCFQIWTASLGN